MKNQYSIVIRTYNEEENIQRSLIGLNQQSHKPDEIIIIDNNSNDKTIEIARQQKTKIPLRIFTNPIKGYSSGLNLGVSLSQFNHVCFLSADCFPSDDWLKEIDNVFNKTNASVVQGIEYPYPENPIHNVLGSYTLKNNGNKSYSQTFYFSNTNTCYKKDVLLNHLPFRDLSLQGGEDTEISIKYSQAGLTCYLANNAKVSHNLFNDIEDFNSRMFKHGKLSVVLASNYPKYPRTYLNTYYWILRDMNMWIKSLNIWYLKVAIARIWNFHKGVFHEMLCNNYFTNKYKVMKEMYHTFTFSDFITILISPFYKKKIPIGKKISLQNNTIINISDIADYWEIYYHYNNIEYSYLERIINTFQYDKFKIALDAGSHIGLFLLISLPTKKLHHLEKIIFVEPDTNNYKMLEKNIIRNSSYKYVLNNKALHTDAQGVYINTQVPSNQITISSSGDTLVESTTIKNLLNENDIKGFDIIKMDIEGAEWALMNEENSSIFNACKLIIIEYHLDQEHKNIAKIYKYFDKHSILIDYKTENQGIAYLYKQNG